MSTHTGCHHDNETGASGAQLVTMKHMKSALEPYLSADKKVLDFGCGDGGVTLGFSRHVREIVGVDPFDQVIERFRKKMEPNASCAYAASNTRAVQVDLVSQPLGESAKQFLQENKESFDIVLSSLALHHVEHVEYTLKSLYGLLKKDGGVACICDIVKKEASTFSHPNNHNNPHAFHLRGFSVEQVTQWLHDCGFTDPTFAFFSIEHMGIEIPLFMVTAKKL